MQRINTAVLAAAFTVVMWSGCNVESVTPDNTPKTITTTVAGQVIDESGKPVQGAQIAAYGKTTVTNQYGTFLIKGVISPAKRMVVKALKKGYFDGFRAEQPAADGITQMRIGLMSNVPQGTFSASVGGTVTAPGSTASVAFPRDGYITENGAAYTGEVHYAVRHLDPTAPNFFDFFSGDFRGVRTDGSATEMISYGVLQVELSGANGEKLNLATGKTATISYPVPAKMTANAPAEMPLWWFEEAKEVWKEEGKAVRQGNFYVGTVSHFTPWNCDDPIPPLTVRVHVTCNNKGVPGVLVRIGQRSTWTDTNGYAEQMVPQNFGFTVKVHPEYNDGIESSEIIAGPYTSEATQQLELPLAICPAYLTGNLYDCGDSPIDGMIIAEYARGGFTFGFARKGGFRFRVKFGAGITLKAISPEGRESESFVLPPLGSNQEYNVGIINTCIPASITATDYDITTDAPVSSNSIFIGRTQITADGSRVFVFHGGVATIVNTATGDIINKIPYSVQGILDSVTDHNTFDISADGSIMLVGITTRKYTLYNANSGAIIREFSGYDEMTLSPDGTTLAAYTSYTQKSFTLATFSTSTGAVIKQTSTLGGQSATSIGLLTDFFTNGTFGVTLEKGGSFLIINAKDFSILRTIPNGGYRVVAQSPDGSVIGIIGNGGNVAFCNTETAVRIGTLNLGLYNYYMANVAIPPTNDRCVAQLYENKKFSVPSYFDIRNALYMKPLPTIIDARYSGLQFSADGKRLVGSYVENERLKLRVWNFQ